MYGTIARMRLKPGVNLADNLQRQLESSMSGLVGTYAYQSDNDPSEVFLVVMFESREAYAANAESEAQHERYLDMMSYLAAEPEWHDGEIIWFADQRLT